jgi:hypothetical protein
MQHGCVLPSYEGHRVELERLLTVGAGEYRGRPVR